MSDLIQKVQALEEARASVAESIKKELATASPEILAAIAKLLASKTPKVKPSKVPIEEPVIIPEPPMPVPVFLESRPSLRVAIRMSLESLAGPSNSKSVLAELTRRGWAPNSADPIQYVRYMLCVGCHGENRTWERVPNMKGYYRALPKEPIVVVKPEPKVDVEALTDLDRDILNVLSVSPRKSAEVATELDEDSYTVVQSLKRLQSLNRIRSSGPSKKGSLWSVV